MNLFSELQTAVKSDLSVGENSSLFPLTTIKLAINRAYIKCGGLFRWPETEDAKKTSTEANLEYYDYPQTWRPDSIWKLTVDGEDYGDPVTFKDYLYEKENDIPSGRDTLWTSQWRRYFIYPTPTTTGSNNISVWGQKIVDSLSSDSDTTIFSYAAPEGNEAIVLEAGKILERKGENTQTGELLSGEAKQLLVILWNKITQDQAKYQSTQPMFDIPDFFGAGSVRSRIGRFD